MTGERDCACLTWCEARVPPAYPPPLSAEGDIFFLERKIALLSGTLKSMLTGGMSLLGACVLMERVGRGSGTAGLPTQHSCAGFRCSPFSLAWLHPVCMIP